ncbi:hypothetical protein TNIN_270871 [Trichonephila inaurata madagascariensis]|uniref:Uncharacterized protein n=1 Tax=Trichonephila inaurata madagascariensis TaxID=2747483 RepID=A0A8X7BUK2_9ARAC|nr:hypothetical protein TNIN_270871 [Trichonephila inaurata madagascariensis]
MNRMFQKHKYCVFLGVNAGNRQCLETTLREVRALGYPGQANYEDKVLGISCKYGDINARCIDNNARDVCGLEAATFRRNLTIAFMTLFDEACSILSQQKYSVQ